MSASSSTDKAGNDRRAATQSRLGHLPRLIRCVAATANAKRRHGRLYAKAMRTQFAPLPQFTVEQVCRAPLPADPDLAQELYSGHFRLGGVAVDTAGQSPFQLSSAPRHWQRRLHSLAWLRHLEAANTALARQLAQSFVEEWWQSRSPPLMATKVVEPCWELDVAAERLTSLITHATFVSAGRDDIFVRRFREELARQYRYVRNSYDHMALTSEHMAAGLSLVHAAYTLKLTDRTRASALRRLGQTLRRQCTSVQGSAETIHISRRPSVAIAMIPMLAATTSALEDRSNSSPQAREMLGLLNNIADEMAHWASVVQHSGGGLAVFNGAREESLERVTSVLALASGNTEILSSIKTVGGYARLSAAGTTIICDVGHTPAVGASARAQAGTLAFEMSSGGERVLMNCGSPDANMALQNDWHSAARQTAAHTALTLGQRSSSSPATSDWLRVLTGHEITAAAQITKCETGETDSRVWLNAQHDGYLASLGVLHRRALAIDGNGRTIFGEDVLTCPSGPEQKDDLQVDLRFHFAPGCRVNKTDGLEARITTPGGRTWTFGVEPQEGFKLSVAPSLQINHPSGPTAIQQIVVTGSLQKSKARAALNWQLSL